MEIATGRGMMETTNATCGPTADNQKHCTFLVCGAVVLKVPQ